MQYMLFCCFDEERWESLTAAERDRIMKGYGDWIASAKQSEHHVGTSKLRPSSEAATVTFEQGKPLVTDGPFAETREQIGGFHVLECESLEEAISIAQRIPTLPAGGRVEVRQIQVS